MRKELKKARIGTTVVVSTLGDETVEAFIPGDLPPMPKPKLDKIYKKLEEANRVLGKLDGISAVLPDTQLFLETYIEKEALLSSQIEGTQSNLEDVMSFGSHDNKNIPKEDTEEVVNYTEAILYGMNKITNNMPISMRLMKEIHKILLAGSRGKDKTPGEFRRSQNWIGGDSPSKANYVPPPADFVLDLMSELETFIHNEDDNISILLKTGMIHVQFESIHPFLDGNGRLGRLLITLILCDKGLLKDPILYLSYFFKKNRNQYYELLQNIRADRGWENWLEFFLDGIIETANLAVDSAVDIMALVEHDKEKIKGIGKGAVSALHIHQFMQQKPVFTIANAKNKVKLSMPAIIKAVDNMMEIGLVREITQNKRKKVFVYTKYLEIISEGTEPIRE